LLCRAICPELAGRTISLKDIAAARIARRRELATGLRERASVVDRLLIVHRPDWYAPVPPAATDAESTPSPPGPRLKRYQDD
jgi:putative transposase